MNKYRGISIEPVFPPSRDSLPAEGGFSGGIVLNVSPQDLEPTQSPSLDLIRVVRGGIQQMYAETLMGSAGPSTTLALGEHKFVVLDDETFEIIFKVFQKAGGLIRIDRWTGAAWVTEIDSATQLIAGVLLGWRSYFNALFLADGERVLKWQRAMSYNDHENDFPTLTYFTEENDNASATIVPAGASGRKYSMGASVEVTGPSEVGGKVVLAVEHGGQEFTSVTLNVPTSSNPARVQTWSNVEIIGYRTITSGQAVTMRLKEIVQAPALTASETFDDAVDLGGLTPSYEYIVEKSDDRVAPDQMYRISFNARKTVGSGPLGPAFITVGVETAVPGIWAEYAVLESDEDFFVGHNEFWYEIPDARMGIGGRVNLTITNPDWEELTAFWLICDSVACVGVPNPELEWREGFEVSVKPFNKATDADPAAGVTYQTEAGISSDLYPLTQEVAGEEEVPLVGRYLGIAAGRLIVLQKDGDPQKIAWSVFGDDEDWAGYGFGETVLGSESDPIDALMAHAPVSSNFQALFRESSIMRMVSTGSPEPAFAFIPWIDHLGTLSPFSVAGIPGGLVFLGRDMMVYMLRESGLIPIGIPIQDELRSAIPDLSVIEGVYDPLDKQYILSTPYEMWSVDIGNMLEGQAPIWHRHSYYGTRPAKAGGDSIVYVGSDNIVRTFDLTTPATGAYWVSPMLNQQNRQAEYSLSRVILRYEADDDTTIEIEGSGDGGNTWGAGIKTTVSLVETDGDVRRAIQTFNITGYDLRFRVKFPSDTWVLLRSWRAEILERGQLGSE